MITDRPSKELLPSESTKRDLATAAVKSLLSAIPVAGGAAAELFGLLNIPLAHRRETWFQDLADRLAELESHISGFRLDTLVDNEQFVSATMQATQAALRTHQQEKLEALRNAVLNCAVQQAPQDDYQTVFLALIDRFSPGHLRLLKSFRNPSPARNTTDYIPWLLNLHGSEREHQWPRWVRDFTPGFRNASNEFIVVLISDLYGASLVVKPEGGFVALPDGQRWITTFGDQFLRFIESPLKA
jgi:hypothetical protein